MMRRRLRNLFLKKTTSLLYLFCFFCTAAQCQDRPRIGLVLIGAGESSIAGIGVIKALDQLHVPIDIVTGSGMGALIGAAFASGLTANQLESIFTANSQDDPMKDVPVSEYLLVDCIRYQDADSQCPDDAWSESLLSNPELITGRNLDILSQRLMARSLVGERITDFDHLPIPFRAVTTDIWTVEPVYIGQGSLVAATRSGLLPLDLANAIDVGGRLLIDIPGYTGANAIRAARELGADMFIVVDTGPPLLSREKVISRELFLEQILTGIGRAFLKKAQYEIDYEDFWIQPYVEMDEDGGVDYPKIIESGRVATLSQQSWLASRALGEEEYRELLRKRSASLH